MFWSVLELILLLLLALLIFTLWQTVRLDLEYWRQGADDRLALQLRGPYGIVLSRLEVPLVDLISSARGPGIFFQRRSRSPFGDEKRTRETKHVVDEVQRLAVLWRKCQPYWFALRPALGFLLSHIRLQLFTWETRLGTGDAATSGLLGGAVWAAKGSLLSLMQRYLKVIDCQPVLTVTPCFDAACFSTHFHCILTVRLTHVMNMQLQFLWQLLRHRSWQRKR